MLLHSATNCSPTTACREGLTMEQLQKAEAPDAKSCCYIAARRFPENRKHRYPSATLLENVFKHRRHLGADKKLLSSATDETAPSSCCKPGRKEI